MEESSAIKKLYGFLQGTIYFYILLEIFVFILSQKPYALFLGFLSNRLENLPFFDNLIFSKLVTIGLIFIVSVATKSKKDLNFKPLKHIFLPSFLGVALIIGSLAAFIYKEGKPVAWALSLNEIIYIITSIFGAVFIHSALDNFSKFVQSGIMKDKFNYENESFEQTIKRVDTPISVNLPMLYYHKKKIKKGWINITNPYRGTMVLGVPGSGKTFSIIIPYIKQLMGKGFTALIYDFKYPDLAAIAYHHFKLNKKNKVYGANHKFHVINLGDVERSRRVNPLHPKYLDTLDDCLETAEALILSLQKTDKSSGADQFFTQSSINFLAGCLYFFSRYENGKYSTLSHVLTFLNKSYEEIFNILFTMDELESILSTFRSSYDNGAFDQLEGQIGTLKINVSKLNSKESAWVFSGDDVNLKISDKNDPSIVILASSPNKQSTTSALNALILNRITSVINEKGNLPTLIAADEAPTFYIHRISNLIATARSNKVAVLLGIQELPQLVELYSKQKADTIISVIGNIFSGAVRKKETLDWLEKVFGKVTQVRSGVSIDRNKTNISFNEQMDFLIPASKISNLNEGEIVAQVASSREKYDNKFQVNSYNCKVNIDLDEVEKEELLYTEIPKYYNFDDKEKVLIANFKKIKRDINNIVEALNEPC